MPDFVAQWWSTFVAFASEPPGAALLIFLVVACAVAIRYNL